MTQTIERAEAKSSPSRPKARVDAWLADFEAALAARDVQRAAGMFATDSVWGDLVSFTWNIKTVEGRDGLAHMLSRRADHSGPSASLTSEEPTEAEGVTEAWTEFESA